MTHRQWVTAFLLSFVPLGIWLIFWFFRLLITRSGPGLAFIIPTIIYVCFQIWLAFKAFTS